MGHLLSKSDGARGNLESQHPPLQNETAVIHDSPSQIQNLPFAPSFRAYIYGIRHPDPFQPPIPSRECFDRESLDLCATLGIPANGLRWEDEDVAFATFCGYLQVFSTLSPVRPMKLVAFEYSWLEVTLVVG